MANEKLIFPIGFDLEEGVKEASKEWKSTYQKQLQKAIDDKPLKVKIDFESKGIDTKEFKQWMTLSREAEKLERERIKNAKEWQKVADQAAMAETRRANATNESNARIERANRNAEASEQRKRTAVERTNAAYKTQGGYLKRLFQRMVAYASVTQAFSFIRNIREVTAQFELQRVALGSIIGDLNEANAMFEQIKAAAVKSPFQIKELVTYTKQLAAYKIESDELFETTQRLADVSAGLGVGMERLVLAYGQIRATGYLRASEVRQLTEAGIPIVEELAKKMSQLRGETVSAAEVMGMISERAISFGMVKEVFDDMTSAGGMFYKMQEKQAETLAGQWSNLQDSISIMYDEIGNTERVNNAMKGMIGLIKSLAENWQLLGNILKITAYQYGAMYAVSLFIPRLVQSTKLLQMAEEAHAKAKKMSNVATQRGNAIMAFSAKQTRIYAYWMRQAANAHTMFGRGVKRLAAMFLGGGWIGAVIGVLTVAVSWFISARKEAKRLNEELSKIETEGALQADQSVRNFERLARAIRESANGSVEQSEAMAEMRRAYGEFLPSQDQEILNLVREKQGYDAVIEAIRKKIALQTQEQQINTVTSEFGQQLGGVKDDIRKSLEKSGLSRTEISLLFAEIEKGVKDGTISLSTVVEKIPEIFKNIVGESVNYIEILNKSGTNFWGSSYLMKYIDILTKYENKLKDIISDTQALNKPSKNLSDTFNTWQKELEKITEGTNEFTGKKNRIFNDESISQINKLTDATARVAEEYDKLAKEKKEVDKALKSEGAKADKDTYAKLQERLGKINEGMSGLYDFLKKYGALDLIKSDDKTQKAGAKSAEQALKDELAAVEKIYKRYQDLRKLKSEGDTQSILAEEFKGVSLTTLSKAYSPKQMIAVYQEALAEAQRLGKKDLVLEIQTKIGEFNVAEEQRKLEKSLKDLSDKISRTKTAKEFFDRMLGMTGDKEFSASLTLSVYGEGGEDLGKKLAEQTIEQLETAFSGVDISSAIDKTTGKVDYAKLAPLIEQLPEKAQANAQSLVDAGMKANADWLIDLQKTYEKAFTFEERRTQVMQEEAQKRKEIEESKSLTPEEKAAYTEASRKKEAERIAAINLEEFKASDDYLKIFEDIEYLSIPIINRLIAKLREFIATNKELNATDLKNLTEQINKLEEGKVRKDAWLGLTNGIRELHKARKALKDAKEGTKEYEDATIDMNKAQVKIQNSLGALQNEFSQTQQLIESFTDTLGIAEDSGFGVFLNGMAEAVGGVSKALAFAQLAVQLFDGTIKSFLASNPIGWIMLIVSAIIGAIQAIMNAKVNRINKEIERLQDHLDNLEYSFERLQKAQEKAFSTDYISNYEQRLANLQAQQEAYLKQADAERSKGKKADSDKIKEYEEQARDTADAIKDMQSELSEYFLGTDLTSAARDFANAWIDAYKEFGSTTDAMKEKFQDMIQNMIVESFAAKVIQSALSDIFTEIDNMTKDGVLDVSEASKIADMTEVAVGNIDVGMTNLMNALSQAGISVRGMGSDLTGISRDIATASEESILGLAAGINTQNFYISQVPTKLDTIIGLLRGENAMQGSTITLQDLVTIQNQHLSYLPSIAQHTAETVAECKQIVVQTSRTADMLERVIKPRGTQATHTLNTTIGS